MTSFGAEIYKSRVCLFSRQLVNEGNGWTKRARALDSLGPSYRLNVEARCDPFRIPASPSPCLREASIAWSRTSCLELPAPSVLAVARDLVGDKAGKFSVRLTPLSLMLD